MNIHTKSLLNYFKNIRSSKTGYIILIILLIILGYFQISFFIHPLKFGAVYFHYPWRWQIVEQIRHGYLPFWLWTQHLGEPIHADPQSGAWYPVVWLFSLFGPYTLYHFHIENILHIIIAALGMRYLAKTFRLSEFSSFLVAIVYVFSGIFSDNVLTSWTISLTWMPIIVGLVIELQNSYSLRKLLFLSLSLMMLVTGGYPAFTITLGYLILIIIVIYFIRNRIKKGLKYAGSILIASLLAILISLPTLISMIQSISYIARLQPISLNYASDGALHINSFISFLFPLTATGAENGVIPVLNSYFTMANSYIGLLPLLLFFLSFFVLNWKKTLPFYLTAFVFILLSLGTTGYLYRLFYHILPGFNLFRYVNFMRAFYIPVLLIIIGKTLDNILNKKQFDILKKGSLILLFLLLIMFMFFLIFGHHSFDYHNVYSLLKGIGFTEKTIIQSLIQIIWLTLFIFILYRFNDKKTIKKALLFFILTDIILSFQMNYLYTGYAPRITVKEAQTVIDSNTHPIKLDNNLNIWKNHFYHKQYLFDFGLNDYAGRVTYFGNKSFGLRGFRDFITATADSGKAQLSNQLLWFSSEITSSNVERDTVVLLKSLMLKSSDYRQYHPLIESNQIIGKINSVDFRPDGVNANIKISGNGFFTLIQNYYPGWQVKVDDKQTKIVITNGTFMSVFLEKGQHKVEFVYRNTAIKNTFYFSGLALLLTILLLIVLMVFKRETDV